MFADACHLSLTGYAFFGVIAATLAGLIGSGGARAAKARGMSRSSIGAGLTFGFLLPLAAAWLVTLPFVQLFATCEWLAWQMVPEDALIAFFVMPPIGLIAYIWVIRQ